MASIVKRCSFDQCKIYACSRCHCCDQYLCVNHLEQHFNRLQSLLTSLRNDINSLVNDLCQTATGLHYIEKLVEQSKIQIRQTIENSNRMTNVGLLEERIRNLTTQMLKMIDVIDTLFEEEKLTKQTIDNIRMQIKLFRTNLTNLKQVIDSLSPLDFYKDKTLAKHLNK